MTKKNNKQKGVFLENLKETNKKNVDKVNESEWPLSDILVSFVRLFAHEIHL